MHLTNATKLEAGYTMAADKDGREWLVVAAKGTYAFPSDPALQPALHAEQAPLVMVDEFTGEPGFSAPLHEIDFPLRKPSCDVLLNGSAYAREGRPTDRVTVSLRVGTLQKSFDVVGNRVWQIGMLGPKPGQPEPFTVMPISYNHAFGGVDRSQEDPAKHRWYPTNHVGVGYHEYTLLPKYIDGTPLPNTEETGNSITNPKGNYRPMAFGPLGRAWQQRIKFAGTYDQNWLDHKFPYLPDDFDEKYFQAAPEDQQTDFLKGAEEVELKNLTANGQVSFKLPKRLALPVLFSLRTGEINEVSASVDTLLIEPDKKRFMLVWRASQSVRRTIREIQQIVIGRTSQDWQADRQRQQRQAGKQRFTSLREMVQSSRQ